MSKKPPKGELSAIAHDVLSSLDGAGKSPQDMAQDLAKEPAAMRRDFFDVLRERARTRRVDRDPSTVVALLSPLVSPGASNKPDFLPKYVKSLFDCAAALAGQQAATATSSLFMTLVTAAETEAEKTKGSTALHFDSLASIDSLVAAFDAVLSHGMQSAELSRTRARWLPLVPELASRNKIPLSQAGAAALVALLSDGAHDLPAAVRLSITPLTQMCGRNAPAIDQQAQTGATEPNTPQAPTAFTQPSLLPEVEKLSDALKVILKQLSTDVESRLANQSKLIQRIESDRTELASQLELESNKASVQRDEAARLNEQIRALQVQLNDSARHVVVVQSELDKYKATHNVVIADAETREQDAVTRTKRELAEKQLVTLRSIRDCIAELSRTHSHERAVRQVVTNFNNFARFLTNSKYTMPDEIAKIEASAAPGGNTP